MFKPFRELLIIREVLIGLFIAIVGGIVVAWFIKDGGRYNPPVASTQAPTSSTAEVPNWTISFEYQFPAGFWTVGNHNYTITSTCPTDKPDDSGSVIHEFTVSDAYATNPSEIYLRWTGIKTSKLLGAESVEGINPSQTVVVVNVFFKRTKSEAEWIATNCTSVVSWDNGEQNQPMLPQTPNQ